MNPPPLPRNHVYVDKDTGHPSDSAALALMPVPDPVWGWYNLSKWAITEYTVTDAQEIDIIQSIQRTLDFSVLAGNYAFPYTFYRCWHCETIFMPTPEATARHCDEPRHRAFLTANTTPPWPAMLGPSDRVPVPQSYFDSTMHEDRSARTTVSKKKRIIGYEFADMWGEVPESEENEQAWVAWWNERMARYERESRDARRKGDGDVAMYELEPMDIILNEMEQMQLNKA